MQVRSAGSVDAEMNVTPMIDVLLVLLIIYMTSIAIRHVIPATLPEPVPPSTVSTPQLVLELLADGGFALNGQPVSAAALDANLRAAFSGREVKLLFVRSAPERPYQGVIDAMDVARGAGAQLLGILPGADVASP